MRTGYVGELHIPETAFGKLYRVWSLLQPNELAVNPWPEGLIWIVSVHGVVLVAICTREDGEG